MRTIKTLNQAFNLSSNQLNIQNLLNGSICTSKGWVKIKLTDDLESDICRQVSEILGGHENTKNRVFNNLYYSNVSHWGLSRLIVNKYKNPQDKRKSIVLISYCAGQDYTSELHEIRTEIKKL